MSEEKPSYSALARLFLRMSLFAFGGPVAHIALAEEEIVVRRKWLTREHFLDVVAATNLIPGPNSTEVMIHVGHVTRGIPGAILSGICFITPSFLLTLLLAMIYVSSGTIPQVNALLWGIKPIIVAIIANVAYRFGKTALKGRVLWLLFVVSLAFMLFLDVHEVVIMLGVGLIYALYVTRWRPPTAALFLSLPLSPLLQAAQESAARAGLWDLFFYFLRIGSVLFGSGYLLIAYIQQDLVNTFGWLSAREVLDAIAIGQITPGPVSTAATVVGYIIAGLPGAVVATVGVFLPSFVLVILTAPLLPGMRKSHFWSAFLAGVNVGVVAAILVTLADLALAAWHTVDAAAFSPLALGMSLVALGLLLRTKLNATWLMLGGAAIGLLMVLLGANG
ncbi:MAG: chromate efflux transporter [Anaerolineae bacterium]